jgi:hypothetical protein
MALAPNRAGEKKEKKKKFWMKIQKRMKIYKKKDLGHLHFFLLKKVFKIYWLYIMIGRIEQCVLDTNAVKQQAAADV